MVLQIVQLADSFEHSQLAKIRRLTDPINANHTPLKLDS